MMDQKTLLIELGKRVRSHRNNTGWTIKEIAKTSGVSSRFLSDLEAGRGNISIARLANVAQALSVPVLTLLPMNTDGESQLERVLSLIEKCAHEDLEELSAWLSNRLEVDQHPSISLVGLRGAGKSTIGSALARHLSITFVELDAMIEEESNLSLSELFSLHGESYYKRLAHDLILKLLSGNKQIVIATGGSVVTEQETWSLLKRRTHSVWLKASPEDHWKRVLGQGDTRPMANRQGAMSELRSILSIRAPLYAEAKQTIDTSLTLIPETIEMITTSIPKIYSKTDDLNN